MRLKYRKTIEEQVRSLLLENIETISTIEGVTLNAEEARQYLDEKGFYDLPLKKGFFSHVGLIYGKMCYMIPLYYGEEYE